QRRIGGVAFWRRHQPPLSCDLLLNHAGLPRRLGWTAPEPSRYNRLHALNPWGESATIPSLRARKSTHARRFTLSPAVRTDPPATHLGGPSAGHGAAQADRRGQRLCRELG